MRGFHIVATDGGIGHVDDFLVEEGTWAVRYLVVDTSNWIGGKSVLISAGVIDAIDSPSKEIRVQVDARSGRAEPVGRYGRDRAHRDSAVRLDHLAH